MKLENTLDETNGLPMMDRLRVLLSKAYDRADMMGIFNSPLMQHKFTVEMHSALCKLFGKQTVDYPVAPNSQSFILFNLDKLDNDFEYMKGGFEHENLISAIKGVRSLFNLSLKDSKDLVCSVFSFNTNKFIVNRFEYNGIVLGEYKDRYSNGQFCKRFWKWSDVKDVKLQFMKKNEERLALRNEAVSKLSMKKEAFHEIMMGANENSQIKMIRGLRGMFDCKIELREAMDEIKKVFSDGRFTVDSWEFGGKTLGGYVDGVWSWNEDLSF